MRQRRTSGETNYQGHRLSVDHVISLFAQGWTEQQVLNNSPRLTQDSLKAIFAYIYECMQDGMFVGSFKKSA
ncbi:DUF433 domain-containing protein [Segetibacter koreensis]|uniref:DUF433 domain-containing protein n=1 Tax=Segetibacter koreensis TaxID=398037 RepID=UPI003CCC099A